MATTSTINHGDMHHQNTVTLHQISSLSQLKSEGKVLSYTVSSDSTEDLIFFHSQGNPVMDFLLEGENGSSRESLANLLDEGLGTSLDGTDEISSSIHPTLGRNDSGVFSSDETNGGNRTPNSNSSGSNGSNGCGNSNGGSLSHHHVTTSSSSLSSVSPSMSTSSSNSNTTTSTNVSNAADSPHKKHRPKNTSPNRQGPQRCAICGKTFSNASALTKHKLTHSDERKHACTVCGKAFKRQDHLNGHMLTHRNKKPFECSAKGCGKSYCDARSLRRHVESRHGHEALATMIIAPTPASSADQVVLNPGGKSVNANGNNPLLCQGSSSPVRTSTSESSSSSGGSSNNNSNNVTELLSVDTDMVGNCSSMLGLDSSNLLETSFGAAMDMDVIEMVEAGGGIKLEFRGNENKNDGDIINGTVSQSPSSMDIDIPTPSSHIVPSTTTNNNNNSSSNNNKNTNNTNSMINHNNNNISLTTEDIKPLIVNGVVVPHQMSRSQSQLHQLLTQRALNANNNVVTGLLPLETLSNKYQGTGSLNSWPNNETEIAKVASVFGIIEASESPILDPTGGMRCPASPLNGACSPSSLKEQLELIHQIIQQTQEESGIITGISPQPQLPPPPVLVINSKPNSKSSPKKSKCSSDSTGTVIIGEGSSSSSSSSGDEATAAAGKPGNEDKPVECTICCRRFKNTPALNGHMRLHGGYFKKDSDGKKKEHSSKESNGTPLQTASISVRALIEEKIIQRRNTIINTQAALNGGTDKNAAAVALTNGSVNQTPPATLPLQLPSSSSSLSSGALTSTTRGGRSGSNSRENQVGFSSEIQSVVSSSVGGNETQSGDCINRSVQLTSSTFPTPSASITGSTPSSSTSQTFPFEYGEDNADYLLMEEEVFNKVSSICPDSFFCGFDESILSGVGGSVDSEQLPPEWSWTSTTGSEVESVNSRLNSLFSSSDGSSSMTGCSSTSSGDNFPKADSCSSNETPFTPLPALDSVFYTSPATQSPSQQDSPSFIYPTPPASLESHNALQSPLFPFPTAAPVPPAPALSTSSIVFPFETQNSNNVSLGNTLITTCSSVSSLAPSATQNVNIMMAAAESPKTPNSSKSTSDSSKSNSSSVVSTSTPPRNRISIISSSSSNSIGNSNNNPTGGMGLSSMSSVLPFTSSPMILLGGGGNNLMGLNSSGGSITNPSNNTSTGSCVVNNIIVNIKQEFSNNRTSNSNVKARNLSGGSISGDLNILTPSPSNSPSLGSMSCSNSSAEDSLQSIKELKVNEPSRMDSSLLEEDLFRSPNRVQNSSPAIKLTKRKQLRNTFASNLRPQTTNSSTPSSHFTPYPILSPVRSAPGLYWTFSTRLSHVDETKKEKPRINVGANFQAILPPFQDKKNGISNYPEKECEDNLWEPEVMELCSVEEVDKYLEFACCSAIPGGGRNKEYALHLLSLCHGDINAAMLLLMNPEPKLPLYLIMYKYPEREKWSRREINSFQEALLRHGKDFSQVAKELGTKSAEQCVMFYQLWKKICSNEYGKVRNVWKKREAAFTIELLKNIPPPTSASIRVTNGINLDVDMLEMPKEKTRKVPKPLPSPVIEAVNGRGLGITEEFPCKVCGKIFSKVKSRSAHMKSHRPPEAYDNNNSKKSNNSKGRIQSSASLVKGGSKKSKRPGPGPVEIPLLSPIMDTSSQTGSSSSRSSCSNNNKDT